MIKTGNELKWKSRFWVGNARVLQVFPCYSDPVAAVGNFENRSLRNRRLLVRVNSRTMSGGIGGLKVVSSHGWFAARPLGAGNTYKIYAESFKGPEHLDRILDEARQIVGT